MNNRVLTYIAGLPTEITYSQVQEPVRAVMQAHLISRPPESALGDWHAVLELLTGRPWDPPLVSVRGRQNDCVPRVFEISTQVE